MSVFPFDPALTEDEQARAIGESLARGMPGFRLDAVHCYRDEPGAALYWRIRLKNHTTGDKRPLPLRRCVEGFELKEPDIPNGKKPLYGLDRLGKDPDSPLWITEGEWCADWMAELGFAALTSGGAQSAGRADWSPLDCTPPQLQGRQVTIWPDNDEPGRRYAAEVTAILRRLGNKVQWVDVVALGLLEGGDYVDWRKAHPTATAADVEALPRIDPPAAAVAKSHSSEAVGAGISPVSFQCVAEIEAKPIRWLWPDRIARGKITMIAGNPGLGKSQLTLNLAAIVSTGGSWPRTGGKSERASVLLISAEDDPADTIRPRLEAAGADLSRCHISREPGFSLADDLGRLSAAIAACPGVALVIIDPISAYLGGIDGHKNAEVRALLAPLMELASKHEVAVVCISHLNKGGGSEAMMRVTGSLAFTATARAAYLVAKDPDIPERRLFTPMKNNLGDDRTGYSFTVESHRLNSVIETSRIVWGEDAVETTADDALMEPMDGEERSALEEAVEFLRETLAEGPMSAKTIRSDSETAGHSWRTVQRAKQALGVVIEKSGMRGGWQWRLPPKDAKNAEDSQEINVAPSVEFGTLRAIESESGGESLANPPAGEEEAQDVEIYGKGKWV